MMEPTWQTDDGRVKLFLADCLDVLPTLEAGSVDAVVTDPPYSSGGAFRGDRTQSTITKYVNSDVKCDRNNFNGDSRDQRSFLAWCSLWMLAARHACREGAVMCAFTDWRQLPVMTDAVQCGGWVWRNLATWWKPGCRMQKGRFSASAEYVIYATNGPHGQDGESSPQNVFAEASLSGDAKDHIAEKPPEVVDWILGVTKARSTVLDPFMGSGAFGEACIRSDRGYLGFDNDPVSFEIAKRRIIAELERMPLFEEKPKYRQRELVD